LTLIGALARGLRWEEFVALYGRIIFHWARSDFGLQHSDADNLRQEVLIRVWRSVGGYDPSKGRFRAWLYACTRNAVKDLRQAMRRDRLDRVDNDIEDPRPTPAELASASILATDLEDGLRQLEEKGFSVEGLQAAVRSVRSRVHAKNWKAFLLFEFFEMRAKEIASLVGLSPAAVNQAVHRVRRLLQAEFATGALPARMRRPVCS
jgi:RNA polymerase sigma-70 factor (ECF subfamily)